jgi:hypothetical protein
VAAEALEQAARVARRERVVQVERRDRRPLPFPTPPRPRRAPPAGPVSSTTRDATIPITPGCPPLPREHEAVGGVEVDPVHLSARLRERGAVDLLAAAVELLELAGDLERPVLVVGGEQSTPVRPLAQPPDRVEARREDEADAARGELPRVEPRRAHERAQAGLGDSAGA